MTMHRFGIAAIAILVASACATTYPLRPAERTPAAAGTINTAVDANNNTELRIHVRHLPPPSSLDPALRTFVVWVRPVGGAQYRNVGQIDIGANREGELRTTTPHPAFDVLVTAEASGAPSQPGAHVVLFGHASRG